MMQDFLIRKAQPADYPAIYEVVEKAFENHPHSDQTKHLIVQRLKCDEQLTLSLA